MYSKLQLAWQGWLNLPLLDLLGVTCLGSANRNSNNKTSHQQKVRVRQAWRLRVACVVAVVTGRATAREAEQVKAKASRANPAKPITASDPYQMRNRGWDRHLTPPVPSSQSDLDLDISRLSVDRISAHIMGGFAMDAFCMMFPTRKSRSTKILFLLLTK